MKYLLTFVPFVAVIVVGKLFQESATGASLDDAFRGGISPDAQTIVAIRMDKLKASDLYKRHEQLLELPQINAMAERAGLGSAEGYFESLPCLGW